MLFQYAVYVHVVAERQIDPFDLGHRQTQWHNWIQCIEILTVI